MDKISQPQNDGKNYGYFLCFQGRKERLENFLHINISNGKVVLSTGSSLGFSIFLNGDIVSVISHVDTHISGNIIDREKMYILEDGDTILCEEVEFHIESSELATDLPPDLTQEIQVESLAQNQTSSIDVKDLLRMSGEKVDETAVHNFSSDEREEEKVEEVKKTRVVKASKPRPTQAKKTAALGSANALIRVLAILVEIAIVLLLNEFITLDKEFLSLFVNFEEIDPKLTNFVSKEWVYTVISVSISFSILRVLSAFILGVSLGQFLLGVKSDGTVLGKRIKALLREFIGLFTGGILVLDIPALFSRRTLKEVLTKSRIEARGFLLSLLLFLLTFSLVSVSWVISPYLTYYDPEDLVQVNMNKRKPKKAAEQEDIELIGTGLLGFSVPANYESFISYNFKRKAGKLRFIPQIELLSEQDLIQVEMVKELKFAQTLKQALVKNPLAFTKFPHLALHIISSENVDKSVKSKMDPEKFYSEVYELTRASFNTNLASVADSIADTGPFVKSYLVYRKSLEKIIEAPVEDIEFKKLNGSHIMLVKSGKSYHLAEVVADKMRLFKLRGKRKSLLRFQKYFNIKREQEGLSYSLLSSLDAFSKEIPEAEDFQQAFEFNFNYMKALLEENRMENKDKLVQTYNSQVEYLELKYKKLEEKEFLDKYIQNMADALQAFKDEEKSFFGIDIVKTAESSPVDE